jgi:hypothetical protein
MPKPVKLGQSLDFATIRLAKAHFDPFRTGGELGQNVSVDQFEQLKVLYEKYCASTQYDNSSGRYGATRLNAERRGASSAAPFVR